MDGNQIYRGYTDQPTYREVLQLEMERHLAAFVADLKRPPWWRPWARRLYTRKVKIWKDHLMSDLHWLLAEQDPRKRTIMATLINWRLPKPHVDDIIEVAKSPDPEVRAMLARMIGLKLGIPVPESLLIAASQAHRSN